MRLLSGSFSDDCGCVTVVKCGMCSGPARFSVLRFRESFRELTEAFRTASHARPAVEKGLGMREVGPLSCEAQLQDV